MRRNARRYYFGPCDPDWKIANANATMDNVTTISSVTNTRELNRRQFGIVGLCFRMPRYEIVKIAIGKLIIVPTAQPIDIG